MKTLPQNSLLARFFVGRPFAITSLLYNSFGALELSTPMF